MPLLLKLPIRFFLLHPLERILLIGINIGIKHKPVDALHLILELLLVGLLFQVLGVAVEPFIKFLADQIDAVDAVKLIDGYDKALIDEFLDDSDLQAFVFAVDVLERVVYGMQILQAVDSAHEKLALLHELVDFLAHESKVVLVHHVECDFHHYLFDHPAIQPLQAASGLLYVQERPQVLPARLLHAVAEDLRVGLVLGEQSVVGLYLLGVQRALGLYYVEEDLLDLQIVLLGRDRGTKERFM